ncbi:MAG: hypothetical protein HQK60_09930 [Deltaproteobacteria bacterium]|nr:hypothetical protein [Deltaproteobacteria bacterium]
MKLYQAMGGGWVVEAEKMAGAGGLEKQVREEKATDKAPDAKAEEKAAAR